ncbi:hypothetical protein HNQ60_000033 [Povalibacter uvarum]|uniref:HipA-like C-terminal domain-containing protein n=1 Tax=Povalibacter uvarum TaxID=732238 RepID=A0A841HEB5_9GAMM|nr:type II toxin-antitoxin system HipA family toxin YjjJ [Povalibacter uvarum]MBB6091187.1 hypothetical protein [Povalibacter uvarum]
MPSSPSDLIVRRLTEGSASSAELEQAIGQSQSAVSRRLRELISQRVVIRLGTTRGARYALLREIEGIGKQWPLRRIDEQGDIHALGMLSALASDEYHFDPATEQFAWSGLSEGIPYFLQDQRPGGFLGRAVPQRYPELGLPQRVIDWNDDHYLRYLTQRGGDTVGDLILGDAALDQYLGQQRHRLPIADAERLARYPQLATQVLEGGLPGSSAHGEHPKFSTLIEDASGPKHVIVKFSPIVTTAVGRRWSDLLIAEHIAHEVLGEAGLPAARSRMLQAADRTYLEVDRFDRHGPEGRTGVTSLLSVDASLYGKIDNWISSATRLRADGRISEGTLEQVRLAATFGELIANTDRHFGNLAFIDRYDGEFALAPIYDMLPMLYKPEHDQIVERVFEPPTPTTSTMQSYGRARELAERYWGRCARDSQISAEFQAISTACLGALRALPRTGAYV